MNPEAALPSDLLQMLAGSPDMGMSDQGFDDYGMGYGDNVVPLFPQEDPEHVVKLREIVMQLQHRAGMPNAVESFEPEKLSGLGQLCVREYDLDESSRDEWRQSADRAMNLAKQVKESKSEPWPNASNVKFPMLTTAALQFAARAYPAIVDGPRVVKGRIIGADPQGIKSGKADRVSQHMSYQLMFEVPNWETDLDTALHQLPIIGCCFKKIYAEPGTEAGFCDDLVSAFDITVNQKAKSLDTVPRITHKLELYPHEIIERQRDGRFVEFEFKGSGTTTATTCPRTSSLSSIAIGTATATGSRSPGSSPSTKTRRRSARSRRASILRRSSSTRSAAGSRRSRAKSISSRSRLSPIRKAGSMTSASASCSSPWLT